MTNMIYGLYKQVGQDPVFIEIENNLKALQELVGGYIEVVPLGADILLVIDEEGKLKGSDPNFVLGYDMIVGNAFFISLDKQDSSEFGSITEEQGELIKSKLF